MGVEAISKSFENDESQIDSCLPTSLLEFASEFSDTVKFTPLQSRKDLKVPKSISVQVSRLKSAGVEQQAEIVAERWRKTNYGITARQITALRRLDYQINQIANGEVVSKVDQVLSGMKMAWYAFAGGIIDEDKRNTFINQIDELNATEMTTIADNGTWVQAYREEISQVLPIV